MRQLLKSLLFVGLLVPFLLISLLLMSLFAPSMVTASVKKSSKSETLLFVRTTPEGAKVIVDGKVVGASDDIFHVSPGVRRIVIELDGHDPAGEEVTIRAGKVTRLVLKMNKREGKKPPAETSRTTGGLLPIGQVVERELVDWDNHDSDCAIDFETGVVYKIPNILRESSHKAGLEWMRAQGIDAGADGVGNSKAGLVGVDCSAVQVDSKLWNSGATTLASLAVKNLKDITSREQTLMITPKDQYPGTYLFKTRGGNFGIVQIMDVDPKKKSVKFRYKMLTQKETGGAQNPGSQYLPLGQTNVRVLSDAVIGKGAQLLDLDTGKNIVPDFMQAGRHDDKAFPNWVLGGADGTDVISDTRTPMLGLAGLNMIVQPVTPDNWNTSSGSIVARGLARGLANGTPGTPVHISGAGEFPATYCFKTREGNIGVLQILAVNKQLHTVRLQWKLLQYGPDAKGTSAEPGQIAGPTRPPLGKTIYRTILDDRENKDWFFDFDTNRLCSPPAELNDNRKPNLMANWAAANGIDASGVKASQGILFGVGMIAAEIKGKAWEDISDKDIRNAKSGPRDGFDVAPALPSGLGDSMGGPSTRTCQFGGQGATSANLYAFRTREGSTGLLEVLGAQQKPVGVKIRYKLFKHGGWTQSPSETPLLKIPVTWSNTKNSPIPANQRAVIGRRLGGTITRQVNRTFQTPEKETVQINYLVCVSEADAKKIHAGILKLKGDPAYCLLRGKTVIEFVGTFDVDYVKKIAVDLELTPGSNNASGTKLGKTKETSAIDSLNKQIEKFNAENTPSKRGISPIQQRVVRIAYDKKLDCLTCYDKEEKAFLVLTRDSDWNFKGSMKREFHELVGSGPDGSHSWGHVLAEFQLKANEVDLLKGEKAPTKNWRLTCLYPGAAPEDVEKLVAVPIEEILKGIEGVTSIKSNCVVGKLEMVIAVNDKITMDEIRKHLLEKEKVADRLPEACEEPVITALPSARHIESKVLREAFNKLFERFFESHKKTGKPMPELAEVEGYKKLMLQQCLKKIPDFLTVSREQEEHYADGKFDDKIAKKRMERTIEVLEDMGAELPVFSVFIVKEFKAGKLSGAQLEIANRVMLIPVLAMIQALQGDEKRPDAENVRELLRAMLKSTDKTAALDFIIVPLKEGQVKLDASLIKKCTDDLAAHGPRAVPETGYRWLPLKVKTTPGWITAKHGDADKEKTYILLPVANNRPWGIENVQIVQNSNENPALQLTFDDVSGERMKAQTKANLRRSMAIVVQGEVISAPTIMAAISTKVQISGSFTKEEVQQLKQAIEKGKE